MRILHLVHQYPPDHLAGTEIYTQTVARRQAAAGHRVAVFSPRAGDGRLDAAEEDGVRVYRIPTGSRGPARVFLSTFGQAPLEAALEETLRSEQPDIVHIQHLIGLPAGAVLSLQERGLPTVLHLHDYWFGCANGQLLTNDDESLCDGPDANWRNCGRCALARAGLPALNGPAAAVAPLLRRRSGLLRAVFAGARRVLAPTDFVRAMHQRMGLPVERVIVYPHGTEPPGALPRRDEGRGRPLRLGYLGSLSRQKGVHVLIEAVNRLPPDRVTLELAGNPDVFPEYARDLRAAAVHPGITFAGPISRERVWAWMASLDALVMPTLWYEASPLVVGEAFAAGLPIIASRVGALPELVRDGQDGLLFSPGDAGALSDVLRALADEPERLARLRENVRPPRTMDDHVRGLDAIYQEILGVPAAGQV